MGQLLAVHRRFGEGDWDARAHQLPKDEFGELGQAFNRTARQVKERYDAQMTAEQRARYSEARFRMFAENIADAIYLYDIDGRIYDVNPAACRSLGYEYHELIQRSIFEVVSSANEESLRRVWRGLITGEHATPLQREARHRRKDGSEFPVEISVVSLQTPDGPLFLGSARDISERKQAEEQLDKLDAKLRELQRVESIGILAGGIAHDFNNLLTGMLGFTRLAQSEAERHPALKSYLQQIEQSALRAAELCQQLLAYAGKGKFIIETIDLSELVRDTAGLIESILKDGVKLQLELADQLPRIEGDATQIRQVVMNLITNASDALEGRAGTVTVRTGYRQLDESWLQAAYAGTDAAVGPHVFVEVRDTGVGMSQETLAKVFDPFFTTKFTGRGLGLAAVLGIVRGHRGAVRIYSEVGKGSTFVVAFPPCEQPVEHGLQDVPMAGRAMSGDAVLVVDDDAAVRTLAAKALESAGLRVLLAEDGAQGLEVFHAQRKELAAVVVDLTMPGISGREVLRAMRAEDANLPLLAMSGYSEQSLETESAVLGLSGFIAKPFRSTELANAILRAIGVVRL
jgi:PAS domain S-box-containing protein